jgi:ribosomal protein S18 acetylase RimI-like enzyme
LEGDVVYLVAWYDEVPVGHVLLEWAGRTEAALATLRDCPHLDNLYVDERFRSRGVGSQLLAAAEALVTQRGFARIGLAVGIDNPRARALYERRGYRDAGLGVHPNRWSSVDRTGQTQWHEETCFYLTKPLPATETGRPLPTDLAPGG